MLRWLVLALAVANLVFFAWTLGWLDDIVGVRAHGDSEPARLARQVRPESVIVLPAPGSGNAAGDTSSSETPRGPADSASSSAPVVADAAIASVGVGAATESLGAGTPSMCLEAGPFTPAQAIAAIAALQAAQPTLPAGSWADVRSDKPGAWIVYMGRYANREALEKKQDELRRVRGAVFEEVRDPPELSLGLSLGRFNDRAKAEQALEALSLRGLRTARVVQLAAPAATHVLRAASVSGTLAAQLAAIRFDVPGRKFGPCAAS